MEVEGEVSMAREVGGEVNTVGRGEVGCEVGREEVVATEVVMMGLGRLEGAWATASTAEVCLADRASLVAWGAVTEVLRAACTPHTRRKWDAPNWCIDQARGSQCSWRTSPGTGMEEPLAALPAAMVALLAGAVALVAPGFQADPAVEMEAPEETMVVPSAVCTQDSHRN